MTMAPKQLSAVLLAACAVLLALAVPLFAGDPDMLQDFCVADYKSLEGRKCDSPCILVSRICYIHRSCMNRECLWLQHFV